MPLRLHLITRPQDPLAQEVVRRHLETEDGQVQVLDLSVSPVDAAAMVAAQN